MLNRREPLRAVVTYNSLSIPKHSVVIKKTALAHCKCLVTHKYNRAENEALHYNRQTTSNAIMFA